MAALGGLYHQLGFLRLAKSVLKYRSIHADSSAAAEAPTLNLPYVDTQLNMHQFTTFFDDESQDEGVHANINGAGIENGGGNPATGQLAVSFHPESLPFPPMSASVQNQIFHVD